MLRRLHLPQAPTKCEVQKDYTKHKSKYDSDTLPSWFGKMDRLFGATVAVRHGYNDGVQHISDLHIS